MPYRFGRCILGPAPIRRQRSGRRIPVGNRSACRTGMTTVIPTKDADLAAQLTPQPGSRHPSMTTWVYARPWYRELAIRIGSRLRPGGSLVLLSATEPTDPRAVGPTAAGQGATARVDSSSTTESSNTESRQTPGASTRRTERTTRGVADGADPQELHNLVVEHSDAIYRLALSVVRDRSLAEDVAQETLVKAWLALPGFRGDASLRSWVLRIAHNTAVSTLRRRRAVVLDPYDMPEEKVRVERSVESRVQSSVVMDEFVEALDLLDELSRSIVVLRELEGLAYDEIADVLNVPMPTVKTRLLRARRRLGSALREWE